MKSTRKIKWLFGSVLLSGLLGMFLISQAGSAFAEEMDLSKSASGAQEAMGGAVMKTGSLSWEYGQAEERLGRMIRDSGPNGAIDQPLLGTGIAEAAQLKWRQGGAQNSLGETIAKNAQVAFNANSVQPGLDVG